MATESVQRRRQPVQERSRLRVARILAAALELLETDGIEGVTTRVIAQRAGVPVATVYQFFPNREAIVSELLEDLLERRDAEGVAVLGDLVPASLDEAIHAILEFHRRFLAEHPQMVALFYASKANGILADPRERRANFARALHQALVGWGLLRPDADVLVTLVAVELGDRIIELAQSVGPRRVRSVFAEGRRALVAYLTTYAP